MKQPINFDAWKAGHYAYNNYKDIADNPYTMLDNFDNHVDWENGYCQARAEDNGD